MKADFYKNYVNYVSAVFVAAALSFCSCSDDRTVASGGLPYKSIRVTVDGETVTAERIDDKNLALRFDMAEDFSHARIDVELSEGYSVIFPTDVTAADLDTYPVLNFRAPDNRIVKVWFTISSKAFPIIDATKVTASGIGGCVSVSGKTLTITYERSMDRGEIELDFAEGALMEGASIASSTTFDFTESLTRQLKVEMDGKERIYNVRIDYSKVMDKPIVYGFSEVTGNYVDQQLYPFLNVYKATTVNSVPVRGAATSETPWSWDPGAGDLDVYLAFIGNWAANRPTETIEGIEFAFATIDIDKAKAYNGQQRCPLGGHGRRCLAGRTHGDDDQGEHDDLLQWESALRPQFRGRLARNGRFLRGRAHRILERGDPRRRTGQDDPMGR